MEADVAPTRRPVVPVLAAVVLMTSTACTGARETGAGATGAAPTTVPSARPSPTVPEPATAGPSESPEPEEHALTTPPSSEQQAALDRRLIQAAWDDDVARARRLIDLGADVNAQDDTQQSAYLVATSEGHLDLLELALRRGADVRAKDSFDGTGLIRAAERGHAHVVGRLVRADIALDHVNNLGWTALHEAVVLGDGSRRYLDTVRVLVAAGADVDVVSPRTGLTPVEHAAENRFGAIATLLREAADLRPGSGGPEGAENRRLLAAAASGDADAAALAVRAGARIETRDENRRTPLLLAATHDRLAVARLLVALGANPDALDDRHDTPWLVTGVTGSVPMLEILLPADPDLTIRNRYGGISVIPASERGHVDYVRRVVRTPIDVNHVNDLGWTALLEAVILGDGSRPYQEIVRVLLDAGADPTVADRDGTTPLAHAEAKGQTAVARILRDAG